MLSEPKSLLSGLKSTDVPYSPDPINAVAAAHSANPGYTPAQLIKGVQEAYDVNLGLAATAVKDAFDIPTTAEGRRNCWRQFAIRRP